MDNVVYVRGCFAWVQVRKWAIFWVEIFEIKEILYGLWQFVGCFSYIICPSRVFISFEWLPLKEAGQAPETNQRKAHFCLNASAWQKIAMR